MTLCQVLLKSALVRGFHERVAPKEPQAVLSHQAEHHDRLVGRSEIRARGQGATTENTAYIRRR